MRDRDDNDRDLRCRAVGVLVATAAACGGLSVAITTTVVRRVVGGVPPGVAAWAVCGAVLWAWAAVRGGYLLMLPLMPLAVVVVPLAVTDWVLRRLPDSLTLPAGSATAAAMAAASTESSSQDVWQVAGPVAGLALAGHVLVARGAVPGWAAALSVWGTAAVAGTTTGSDRLTDAVIAGSLTTGVILLGHLVGLAGFGDVKIGPLVCCAAWAVWDPVSGFWAAAAAAFGTLWLSVVIGGLVAVMSQRAGTEGVPLGSILPGATLIVAIVGTWL